jgi:hypothetical protein
MVGACGVKCSFVLCGLELVYACVWLGANSVVWYGFLNIGLFLFFDWAELILGIIRCQSVDRQADQ